MRCPKCGREIEDNSVFCNYCGHQMYRNHQFAKEPTAKNSSSNKMKKTIPLVILIVATLIVVIAIVTLTSGNNEERPYDYKYELGYDGYYIDIANYRTIISGCDDERKTFIKGLDENGFGEIKTYKSRDASGYIQEFRDRMILGTAFTVGNDYLISFNSGTVYEDDDVIEAYFKEYVKKHPGSGKALVPVYWASDQYYLVDGNTGQMHFLPVSGAWIYDYGIGKYSDFSDPKGSCIAISDSSVYFEVYDELDGNGGYYKFQLKNNVLYTERLFDLSVTSTLQVARNDVLKINENIAILPDMTKIMLPEGCKFINGYICKDIELSKQSFVGDVDRLKKRTEVRWYPVSAYSLQADGSYQYVTYTDADIARMISDTIYLQTRTFYGDNSKYYCYHSDRIFATDYEKDGIFCLNPNSYYRNELNYIKFESEKLIPYPVESKLFNTAGNIVLFFDGTSLYMHNAITKKISLIGEDVINYSTTGYYGYFSIEYSDESFKTHTKYIWADGSITEEKPQYSVIRCILL